MKQNQSLRQTTRQKADFRLIAATQLLQKGALSLRQFIQDELASNPALELATDFLCPTCGSPLRNGDCRICRELRFVSPAGNDVESEQPVYLGMTRRRDSNQEEASDFGDIVAPVLLADHLRAQARTALPATDHTLADYIIANIGEKGLLETAPEEISQDLDISLDKVFQTLEVIQWLDPLGVGARTPQEALLIQLHSLSRERAVDPWAERIIEHCWEDLAYQRYPRIARLLGCNADSVKQAVDFIKENLNPYPASAFITPPQVPPSQNIRWVDLIIHREQDEYRVEVVESFESELRVSDTFLRLRRAFADNKHSAEKPSASLESLRRACFFLACLKMRKKTLQDVAECVASLQRGYLDTGLEEHLRPLTRAKVASLLGKHESTVSRAVADKYLLLPNKQLIAFEKFFTPGAGAKSIIRELIQREVQGRPLTDRQISRILESRGHRLARRTIAKYRLLLHIPPSSQRRGH